MKFIAYYRVSTQRQGQSGLGIEAQESHVAAYAASHAGTIVEAFTEWETGKNSNRPKLAQALAAARKHKATLVIAKLDRLARNVAFVANLMESKVPFVCCDHPTANDLTIHILSAVAQNEAKAISDRTRDALQAKRMRGEPLGNPANLTPEASQRGREANTTAAQQHNAQVLPLATKLRRAGKTLQEIADSLTRAGVLTRRGCAYSTVAVMRLLRGASATA